ncbi:MAG: spermidine/putrescine ABC transporter substrate-binding protein [Pseudomonadales bacterium]|nr:spermidine/putrescine ABC transporter substrate-binding protein [Pseudomonadales bacterium]
MAKKSVLFLVILIVCIGFVGYFGSALKGKNKNTDSVFQSKGSEPPVELKALLWSGYINEEIIAKAEKTLNLKITLKTFDSNDEFEKILGLTSENRNTQINVDYDLLMPTDFMVSKLAERKLIRKIDYESLTNYQNIALDIRRQALAQTLFQYAVPYIYGSLGIGYNYWEIGNIVFQWKDLFEPDSDALFKGRIAISGDARNSLGIALMALGKSPNTRVRSEIEDAGRYLKKIIGQHDIQLLNTGMAKRLGDQELLISMAWSGEIAQLMYEASSIVDEDFSNVGKIVRFSLPDEGALVFFDSFAIPVSTSKSDAAMQFINFLLDPEISAEVTNTSFYATVNKKATQFIEREIINGPAYFIPPHGSSVFSREYLGADEAIYREVWDDVVRYQKNRNSAETEYEDARSKQLLWKF